MHCCGTAPCECVESSFVLMENDSRLLPFQRAINNADQFCVRNEHTPFLETHKSSSSRHLYLLLLSSPSFVDLHGYPASLSKCMCRSLALEKCKLKLCPSANWFLNNQRELKAFREGASVACSHYCKSVWLTILSSSAGARKELLSRRELRGLRMANCARPPSRTIKLACLFRGWDWLFQSIV